MKPIEWISKCTIMRNIMSNLNPLFSLQNASKLIAMADRLYVKLAVGLPYTFLSSMLLSIMSCSLPLIAFSMVIDLVMVWVLMPLVTVIVRVYAPITG